MENNLSMSSCPFCSGPAEVVSLVRLVGDPWDEAGYYEESCLERKFQVRCQGGDCPVMPETVLCATPEEAVELWNRRV